MNKNSFEYNYSASEQQEIRRIREKYLPRDERTNKFELLKKLDSDAEKPGTIVSLVLGVIGTLLLGTGLSCVMVWGSSTLLYVIGICVGIAGIAALIAAYPAYKKITRKQREKIAPQIISLADELEK